MTVYVKKPKKPTKQLLDLASDHSKVADFEINMQKSVVFLYSSNEHMETINAISLTLRKKKKKAMQYLSINLTKYAQALYAEKY